MNIKRFIFGPLLSLIFLISFVYMISGMSWIFDNLSEKNKDFLRGDFLASAEGIVSQADIDEIKSQQSIEINAKSAISIESDLENFNEIVVEKNSNEKLSIASLTKLMTAVIVLDNYNLANKITIDSIADSQAPMKQDVKLGDTLSVENLLDIMLVRSSNKAAYALSEGPNIIFGEKKFISLMNRKAKNIGMVDTFFADSTGQSEKNISTANDLVILAEYILKNKIYSKISEMSKVKKLYIPGFGEVDNTNELLGEVPNIVCGKTGFTTTAKGCLLLVVNNPKNNNYLINVVLGADDRFSEMKKIVEWSSAACN